MTEKAQPDRWRCLAVGCNPKLIGQPAAASHKAETGHRVAKWPVRSAEGRRRARARNRSGYYDRYNVGAKSYPSRLGSDDHGDDDFHGGDYGA